MAKDLTPTVVAWLNEQTGAIVHETYAAALRKLDKDKAPKLELDALASLANATPLCKLSTRVPTAGAVGKLLSDVLAALPDYTDGRNDKLVQRIKKTLKELDAGTP